MHLVVRVTLPQLSKCFCLLFFLCKYYGLLAAASLLSKIVCKDGKITDRAALCLMCWFLSVPGTRQYSLVSPCCRQGLLVTLFSPAIEVEASTRNRSERQREKLPAVLCSPFQTQLALHVIVSRFNRVQLLFVCPSGRQWSRSQALCRG